MILKVLLPLWGMWERFCHSGGVPPVPYTSQNIFKNILANRGDIDDTTMMRSWRGILPMDRHALALDLWKWLIPA